MKFINIHSHSSQNEDNIFEIVNNNFNSDKFSYGIHPWDIEVVELEKEYELINKYLQKSNCLMLGECGLDKTIKTNLKLQTSIFVKQLDINKQYNKPVVIHCVKSFQEMIAIKKNYTFPFIIHGFNKKNELANQLINHGFFLSFGEVLLSNDILQDVFINTPLNKLFLETDDFNISIVEIYKKAAELKGITIEELILSIDSNFKQIF